MPVTRDGQSETTVKGTRPTKASHRDLAYGVIRREILLGRLKHGTRINECVLAKKLGISRTPVREALLCLHGEGILCKKKGGLEVTKLSPKDMCRQIEFRAILECAAVKLAARRITAQEIERLQEVIAHQEILIHAKEWEAFVEADLTFHHLILKATDNPFLSRMTGSLALGQLHFNHGGADSVVVVDGQRYTIKATTNDVVVAGHQRILDALAKGQAEKAEELMYAHVTNSIFDSPARENATSQNTTLATHAPIAQ